MNVVDWVIVGIIGVSVLFGLYRGFIASVASMGGSLLSLGGSYWLTPKVADYIRNSTSLQDTIASNLDVTKLIGDQTMAETSVNNLQSVDLESFLGKLPEPLRSLLDNNLTSRAFASLEDVTQNVKGYAEKTLTDAAMNVICFLACFVLLMLLFHIIIVLLKTIFKFPVLKQMNAAAGGVFGFLRGVLICFVAFALVPLIQTVLPMDSVNDLIAGSSLASVFNSRDLIQSIMRGHL